jgi:CHASE3 domain sensor protein
LYSRALRLSCGLLALIAIGVAAFLLIRSEQQIIRDTDALRAFDQQARDASAALVEARVGQQAYVAAGQGIAFWFGKTGTAVQAATDGLAALRETAGPAARTALDQAGETVAEFSAIDARARDYLESGEQLMAGDVIFTEGSDAAATAVRQIETARQAQHQAADGDAAAVRKQEIVTAGAAAAVVFLLLLLLIPMPRAAVAAKAAVAEEIARTRLSIAPTGPPVAVIAPAPVPIAPTTNRAQGTILKAATAVATEFGRVRDLDELSRVLARAAEVMDATGVMVWIGGAGGADLRPALAHGYSAEMVARIPPVPRSADNAAAAAYRSGTLQIVVSRPGGARGAVVAPILAADGCIGALSAEIRNGGETSESVQALATIFAAHLAGVLSTAPAAVAPDIIEPRAAAANS